MIRLLIRGIRLLEMLERPAQITRNTVRPQRFMNRVADRSSVAPQGRKAQEARDCFSRTYPLHPSRRPTRVREAGRLRAMRTPTTSAGILFTAATPVPSRNTGDKLRSSEVDQASSASSPCWTAPFAASGHLQPVPRPAAMSALAFANRRRNSDGADSVRPRAGNAAKAVGHGTEFQTDPTEPI